MVFEDFERDSLPKVGVTIRLDQEMIDLIDEYAETLKTTRGKFLRGMVRMWFVSHSVFKEAEKKTV
jgi:hypothetical protein